MLDKVENESWKKGLKMFGHCPVCDQQYNLQTANLLSDKKNANYVHITCQKCKSNFMAITVVTEKGAGTVGMITDLSFEDVKRLHLSQPITLDEIINAHKFINSKNFAKLIIKR